MRAMPAGARSRAACARACSRLGRRGASQAQADADAPPPAPLPAGGAGIILSRGAMRIIAPNLARCAALTHVDRLSDATLAKCVLIHGIPPTIHPGLHQNDFLNPK
jgi:hypothetical protein